MIEKYKISISTHHLFYLIFFMNFTFEQLAAPLAHPQSALPSLLEIDLLGFCLSSIPRNKVWTFAVKSTPACISIRIKSGTKSSFS
jgi:hypothetical protein